MMQFYYNPKITGKVIKDRNEQFDKFFRQGHPLFLIPDFNDNPTDIWQSYMDFLEREFSCEVYDQDGGEITSFDVIDTNTGLTKCVYTAYGVMMEELDETQDVDVEIEGYVVEYTGSVVFVATEVHEGYKLSI